MLKESFDNNTNGLSPLTNMALRVTIIEPHEKYVQAEGGNLHFAMPFTWTSPCVEPEITWLYYLYFRPIGAEVLPNESISRMKASVYYENVA